MIYYPLTASACCAYQDEGNFITGVGDELWNKEAACGNWILVQCIEPTNQAICTGNAVMAKIVDHNPGAATLINLSVDAFSVIADPHVGSVKVEVVE